MYILKSLNYFNIYYLLLLKDYKIGCKNLLIRLYYFFKIIITRKNKIFYSNFSKNIIYCKRIKFW